SSAALRDYGAWGVMIPGAGSPVHGIFPGSTQDREGYESHSPGSVECVDRHFVEVDRGADACASLPGVHHFVASTHRLFALEQRYSKCPARGAIDKQKELRAGEFRRQAFGIEHRPPALALLAD